MPSVRLLRLGASSRSSRACHPTGLNAPIRQRCPAAGVSLSNLDTGRRYKGTGEVNRWQGAGKEDQVLNKRKQGDAWDEQAINATAGREEREKNEKNTDATTSQQGVTESDQRGSNEKAKKEHPKAPGPVIGMNDEKGSVSRHRVFIIDYLHIGSDG